MRTWSLPGEARLIPVMGETVLVLVLNAGSSSLKFNLFDMGKEVSVAEG